MALIAYAESQQHLVISPTVSDTNLGKFFTSKPPFQ